jgi:hypothetical protein
MKRGLFTGAILTAALLGSGSTAMAGDRWSFGFGFGSGGFHVGGGYAKGHPHHRRVHRHHRPVHHHVRVPVYIQEWVPPVHETVYVGRDHCGRPIYREVCVRRGYYRSVISGYRCNSCGAGC